MNPLDLRIGCVARRKRSIEKPAGPQTRSDHLHAVGRLWMPEPAEMIAVERIGNELQECFGAAAGLHVSVDAFCTFV